MSAFTTSIQHGIGSPSHSNQTKREITQINKIGNERGETTTYITEIQRIVRNYYGELYAKKCENLGETDTFLAKYNLPK